MQEFITDPAQIEEESMQIIDEIMQERMQGDALPFYHRQIIKRIVHTTADPEYADITEISETAPEIAEKAIREGKCRMLADTRMICAGLNGSLLQQAQVEVDCFVDTPQIREMARGEGITRAMANIRLAPENHRDSFYIIGNAPTALFELLNLAEKGEINPALVVGVPVGFVGAQESKEELRRSGLPYIITRGKKGGSTVAVAIVHALLKGFVNERRQEEGETPRG